SPIEDFGEVALGRARPEPQPLRLKNIGTAPLLVGPFGLEGAHGGDFKPHDRLLAQWTLAPGEERALPLPFTPGGRGRRSASLRLASNDTDHLDNHIALVGAGLQPILSVQPLALVFDTVPLGGPAPPGLTVTV